jgi:hypothetical protein
MKEQLKEIVDTLITSTENGSLFWKESDPNSKTRAYKRKMEANGSDGTVFTMNIEYMLSDGSWKFEENGIWIKNDILPEGNYNISAYKYKELLILRDLIKEKFCSDLNPKIKDVEDILSDICKGISISTLRDNKLNQLGL